MLGVGGEIARHAGAVVYAQSLRNAPQLKTFNDKSFSLIFNRLVSEAAGSFDWNDWRVDDVGFQRQRHTHWGRNHSFSLDIYTLRGATPRRWELIVVRETWWGPDRRKSLRSSQWAKLIGGSKAAALGWFRREAREFDAGRTKKSIQ